MTTKSYNIMLRAMVLLVVVSFLYAIGSMFCRVATTHVQKPKKDAVSQLENRSDSVTVLEAVRIEESTYKQLPVKRTEAMTRRAAELGTSAEELKLEDSIVFHVDN